MVERDLPFYGKLSDAEYFDLCAWDQTQLKQWLVSPAYWAAARDAPSSPAMMFGSACHSLVLGDGAPVAAEGSDEAERNGVIVLPQGEFDRAHKMADTTRRLFTHGGRTEMTMVAHDPATGLPLKGKADFIPNDPGADGVLRIVDYKTAAYLDDFSRTILLRGYDIQAAFYTRLWRLTHLDDTTPVGFRFVVQEKHAPYDYIVRDIDPDSIVLADATRLIDLGLQDIVDYLSVHGQDKPTVLTAGRNHSPQQVEWPDSAHQTRDQQIQRLEQRG